MPGVAVITDSTAYLPVGVAERFGITVVPLHVALGTWSGLEAVEVSPADVARALGERRVRVTTSRPTPGQLAHAYRATGATEVVSVHLSSALSGTADSARLAAEHVAPDITVRVVDSGSIAMGLGFDVIAAAEVAQAGGSLAEAAAAAETALTTALFYVDTLEHLRRGGRVTATSAIVGTALAVKPLLVVSDGEISLLEKVRTFSKALSRLEELAVEAAGDGRVQLAIHHLAAPERAAQLEAELRVALPHAEQIYVSEVGAVVGAHVGPGLLGVVVWRR
ncbi:MAG: fatty acid-binding protein DegV [Frankiales bacterium]|nr:fatty acid-binding protein DegV [Frankiales bacterium]